MLLNSIILFLGCYKPNCNKTPNFARKRHFLGTMLQMFQLLQNRDFLLQIVTMLQMFQLLQEFQLLQRGEHGDNITV